MVKTHKSSRFCLYTLSEIRDTREVVLQVEDTRTQFTDGQKCYLCEVVNGNIFSNTRTEKDLINEICTLNNEKRKLEKKIRRLEKIVGKGD